MPEEIQKIKHEIKTCPRCGTAFECRVGDILRCQCYGITMNADQQREINNNYDDCLCRSCLEALTASK